ncbi:hypothetical protein BJ508DRAFT_358226 [Ascobolus immersus RN42]|uniref:Uncharacterized protein n=1 Tax=Ascobolus immersus RN42 TaxID=1160509 RepID=A0A3N4IML6_ASCIM|nr:hypothetical protein BJ508DRAFT_358226 [Ascobolus immersus RN42]
MLNLNGDAGLQQGSSPRWLRQPILVWTPEQRHGEDSIDPELVVNYELAHLTTPCLSSSNPGRNPTLSARIDPLQSLFLLNQALEPTFTLATPDSATTFSTRIETYRRTHHIQALYTFETARAFKLAIQTQMIYAQRQEFKWDEFDYTARWRRTIDDILKAQINAQKLTLDQDVTERERSDQLAVRFWKIFFHVWDDDDKYAVRGVDGNGRDWLCANRECARQRRFCECEEGFAYGEEWDDAESVEERHLVHFEVHLAKKAVWYQRNGLIELLFARSWRKAEMKADKDKEGCADEDPVEEEGRKCIGETKEVRTVPLLGEVFDEGILARIERAHRFGTGRLWVGGVRGTQGYWGLI